MYFYGRRHLWRLDDESKQETLKLLFPELAGSRVDEIRAELFYWRKFNALHHWFVENVQNGIDNCEEAEVSVSHLKTLKDQLDQVSANPQLANKLMPVSSGFFFGSTEYSDSYFREVERTRNWLDDLLLKEALGVYERWYFFYRSSW
jgi:hypothetical protein